MWLQAGDVTLPIRVLHLPMAFNERWTHGAIQKYMRSVRSEAPYLPSNVDFVAANNGLTGLPRYTKLYTELQAETCRTWHYKCCLASQTLLPMQNSFVSLLLVHMGSQDPPRLPTPHHPLPGYDRAFDFQWFPHL